MSASLTNEYLARKVSRAKWEPCEYITQGGIRADAITGCLRTKDDTLSLWQCQNIEDDITEVVLALSTAMERLDTINIVLLDRENLGSNGVSLQETPGNTPVAELCSRHIDIVNLDMSRLCIVANHVASKIRNNADCYTFTKTQIRKLLCKAIQEQRLKIDDLKNKLKTEVQQHL